MASKKTRLWTMRIVGTVVGLISSLLVMNSVDAASGPVSVIDYSQCANGQPPSVAVTCTGGWINGILQASNSHFKESQVTPQRAVVKVNTSSGTCTVADKSGCHSFTLTYQARKGTTHAYDSLATWNHTVTGADRCVGLTPQTKNQLFCPGTQKNPTDNDVTPSELAITPDSTEVEPVGSGVSEVTSDHDLASQKLQMFGGGVLVAMTEPDHDNEQGSGDDYATTTIYYSATQGQSVELLFGGHIAVSTPTRGGWGDGLGASNINGGPYHIKWAAADGSSVGSRDNQIMGSSIAPLLPAEFTTANTAVVSVTLGATALVGVAEPQYTGTFTFTLYRAEPGTAAESLCASTGVVTSSTATAIAGVATSATVVPTTNGIYNWVISYGGDAAHASTSGTSCGIRQTTVDYL